MRFVASTLAAALLALPACFQEPEPSSTDGDGGTEDEVGETAETETETETGTETTAGGAECGNGVVEEGEQCDDGNADETDDCTSLCAPPSCEDGIVSGDETDLDCGGSCEACDEGQECSEDEDCESMSCYEGSCAGTCEAWDERLGTAEIDAFYGLAMGPDGGVFATGATGGMIGDDTSMGGDDVLLARYDVDGNLAFVHQFGSTEQDTGLELDVGADGTVAVVGMTYGDFDGNLALGDRDALLSVHELDGAPRWSAQIGTELKDTAYAVSVTDGGRVLVAITTLGGYDGEVNGGAEDIVLVAFDAEGEELWSRQFSEPGVQFAGATAIDPEGALIVAGWSLGPFAEHEGVGGDDVIVIKLGEDGGLLWSAQLGTAVYDKADAVTTDAEGNIYLAGQTLGTMEGAQAAGGFDLFVMKVSPDGELLWAAQHGSPEDELCSGVAVDADGNIYVAGTTMGTLGEASSGGEDVFVAKFDDGGQLEWVEQRGSEGAEANRDAVVGPTGEVIAGGFSYGDFGGASFGMADATIGRYCGG